MVRSRVRCRTGAAHWQHVRPPLMPLADADVAALEQELDAIGFTIDGLA
ncbi:MAG: hypothetical protein R3E83_11580 [Burkholderiaceae bacterium]